MTGPVGIFCERQPLNRETSNTTRVAAQTELLDVLAIWQKNYAENAWGDALPCGHYVPEEAPDETYAHFIKHFQG